MIIEFVVPEPDTTEKILPEAILTFIRDAFAILLAVTVDGIVRLFIDAVNAFTFADAFILDRLSVLHRMVDPVNVELFTKKLFTLLSDRMEETVSVDAIATVLVERVFVEMVEPVIEE